MRRAPVIEVITDFGDDPVSSQHGRACNRRLHQPPGDGPQALS